MDFENKTWYQISHKIGSNRTKKAYFNTKRFQATKVCKIEQK